jgi:hypothetical protein
MSTAIALVRRSAVNSTELARGLIVLACACALIAAEQVLPVL